MANTIYAAFSHARSTASLVDSARGAAAFAAAVPGDGAPRGSAFRRHRHRERNSPRTTALVIGGRATQQRFCAIFLETLGLSVVVAADFCKGVRALAEATPRLVILDAQTGGFDPAAWRRIAGASDVRPKVFVVAGAAERENVERLELAVDGYLQRPIRSLDLVRAAELAAR